MEAHRPRSVRRRGREERVPAVACFFAGIVCTLILIHPVRVLLRKIPRMNPAPPPPPLRQLPRMVLVPVTEAMDALQKADAAVPAGPAALFHGDRLANETLPPLEVLCPAASLPAVASAFRAAHLLYRKGSPAAVSSRPIPLILHQTSKANATSESRQWAAEHPALEHIVWSDQSARAVIDLCLPALLPMWDELPLGVFRSDLLRYAVLFLFGGVWADADTIPVKPFGRWLEGVEGAPSFAQVGLMAGLEAAPDKANWREDFTRNPQMCQWTIASRPQHPVMEKVLRVAAFRLQHLSQRVLRQWRSAGEDLEYRQPVLYNEVMDSAGPGTWTDVIDVALEAYAKRRLHDFRKLKRGVVVASDILLLPVTAFASGQLHSGSKPSTDSEARVKHLFHGSWKNTVHRG